MRSILLAILSILFPALCLAQPASRIISLTPATTEILYELGLESSIAAVSAQCDYPPESLKKPKAGSLISPNMERIIQINPDLILATGQKQAAAVNALRNMGFKVVVCDPSTLEELLESIELIGRLTGKPVEAQKTTLRMRKEIEAIREQTKLIMPAYRKKVFLEIWFSPLFTAGARSYINEMIQIAGGINIAGNINRPYCVISPEILVREEPDVLITAYHVSKNNWGNYDNGIQKHHKYRLIHDIDQNLLLRPGPRITQGIKEMHKRLYP